MTGLSVGRFPVSPRQLAALLWAKLAAEPSGLPPAIETVVLRVRAPRVLAEVAVGAALAAAGAAYQGLFRNPLVSPGILGVSSGAALGATLGIYLSWGVAGIQGLSFALGLAAVAVVYALGASLRRHDPVLIHAFLCADRVALLHRGRLSRLGPPVDVITPESLREVYGVEVGVREIARPDGRTTRVCVPALGAAERWPRGTSA